MGVITRRKTDSRADHEPKSCSGVLAKLHQILIKNHKISLHRCVFLEMHINLALLVQLKQAH